MLLTPDPAAGEQADDWAALARPVEPGTSGENQYLVTADGAVFRRECGRQAGDAGDRAFFAEQWADIAAADGTIDPSHLAANGWRTAR